MRRFMVRFSGFGGRGQARRASEKARMTSKRDRD